MIAKLRDWAWAIKSDILALYLAVKDPRVPFMAKFIAILVVAYAFSPIDLIPDFIPILGLLDDVILLPLGIILAKSLIPNDVMAECRVASQKQGKEKPAKSRLGMMLVILTWCAALFFTYILWRHYF